MISVTIATYKRRALLSLCLSSLAEQTLSPCLFEVIVCDSFSDDGSDEMIRQFCRKWPSMSIRHVHTKNVLAAKRNLGIRESRGNVVVFFDDDCVPHPDCLKNYYELFSCGQDTLTVFCGEVRFPAKWVNTSNYYRFRDSRHFGSGHRSDLLNLDYRTIVVMNMAFRRDEFLDRIASVDEHFIGYGCEDQDLGWRLQEAGFSIKAADALIFHYEPSGDINGYAKKLFHTGRDGMATLLKRNPRAALGLGIKLKLLDLDCPDLHRWQRVCFSLARVMLFPELLEAIITRLLILFDRVRSFYFPFLYKYVLACAYVRGAKARSLNNLPTHGWYD